MRRSARGQTFLLFASTNDADDSPVNYSMIITWVLNVSLIGILDRIILGAWRPSHVLQADQHPPWPLPTTCSQYIPPPPLSCDNQRCLHTLPSVPWKETLPLVEDHCNKPILQWFPRQNQGLLVKPVCCLARLYVQRDSSSLPCLPGSSEILLWFCVAPLAGLWVLLPGSKNGLNCRDTRWEIRGRSYKETDFGTWLSIF